MCAKAPWSLWSSTVVWAMPLWHRHRFNISHVLCYHRLLLFVQFRERWEASFYHFSLCFLSHTCGIYKSAPSLGMSSVFPSQIWMPYLLPEKGFRARLWYVGVQFRIVSWWLVALKWYYCQILRTKKPPQRYQGAGVPHLSLFCANCLPQNHKYNLDWCSVQVQSAMNDLFRNEKTTYLFIYLFLTDRKKMCLPAYATQLHFKFNMSRK